MSTVLTDSPVTPMSSLENSPFSTDAAKWEAVCRRDPAADGVFFYSVRTTGVYCRPSCGARLARLEHVAFFLTASHAERAGFRPCRRCLPHLPPRSEREASMVAEACRFIESSEEIPGLAEMSAHAGVSPHHFHRIFKRVTGVTPKSYAAAHRQAVVQKGLGRGVGITEAMYGAGFNSSARFYETAPEMFGMTPSAYRKGGEGETVWHAEGRCSLGCVLVAATKRGVCAILLGEDSQTLLADLKARFAKATIVDAEPSFGIWVDAVVRFVDDPAAGFGLPLDIRGTAFQRRVWEALRSIPPGKTVTYSELAKQLGNPRAVRAVAGACGANSLAIAIPCHRAIAANGALAGYRWGIDRKRKLLDREQG